MVFGRGTAKAFLRGATGSRPGRTRQHGPNRKPGSQPDPLAGREGVTLHCRHRPDRSTATQVTRNSPPDLGNGRFSGIFLACLTAVPARLAPRAAPRMKQLGSRRGSSRKGPRYTPWPCRRPLAPTGRRRRRPTGGFRGPSGRPAARRRHRQDSAPPSPSGGLPGNAAPFPGMPAGRANCCQVAVES